jgi:protein involved in polysaccharide export with SLBB domain
MKKTRDGGGEWGNYAGKYVLVNKKDRVSDIIQRAGGLTLG